MPMTRGQTVLFPLPLIALMALTCCRGERAPAYGAPSPGAPTEAVGRTPEEDAYPGAPPASGVPASSSPTSPPLERARRRPLQRRKGRARQRLLLPTATPTPATGAAVTVELTAANFSFSRSRLEVARGAQVVLRFRNEDGVAHNFALDTGTQGQEGLFSSPPIGPRSSTEFAYAAPNRPGSTSPVATSTPIS